MSDDDLVKHLTERLAERERAQARVEAHCAELSQRVRELERAKASLDEFAYIVSHDLQEPLRTVASYMALVSARHGASHDEEQRRFIDHALTAAQRAQDLVRDLLSYARIGDAGPHCDVDVRALLKEVLEGLALAVTEVDAHVTYGRLPVVFADPKQISSLFRNLLSNALKYRSAEPPRIHVEAYTGEGVWVFEVRDNGIGIAPRHHERIFKVFQRLHGRERYEGTGVGLALCKRIVEIHGGQIGVHSAEGAGSTFWFTLPARDASCRGLGAPQAMPRTGWVPASRS